MTPLSEAVTELRLVVAHAEDMAPGPSAGHAHLEDFRADTIGNLVEALDNVDQGLGTRLLCVMYTHADAQGARA